MRLLCLLLVLALSTSGAATAQSLHQTSASRQQVNRHVGTAPTTASITKRPPGGATLGIGAVFGDGTGLSLKWYGGPGLLFDVDAYEGLLAWHVDDFLFADVHGLYERPFSEVPLQYFYGPGFVLGTHNGDVSLGLSGIVGAGFFIHRLEFFLQLTPHLHLLPGTEADLRGGLGLRYYL